MPFVTGTAPTEDTSGTFREAGHQKLFRAFRRYITGSPDPGAVADPGGANTGNGVVVLIDTKPGAPAETWTFTATSATNFTVSGSTSGAQAALTANTNYENSFIAARIETGGVAFVAGDNFQCILTASGNTATNDRWVIQATYDYFGLKGVNNVTLGTPNHEIILKGIGLAGADAVYVGIRLVGITTDTIHNWEIKGFTGASGSVDFDSQPGASTSLFTAFWDQSIPYWFVVNGRRFIVVGKVSGNAHSLYAGFLNTFATPSEYPYPLFIGGEEDIATIHSSTIANFSFFADPQAGGALIRDNVGVWNSFANQNTGRLIWPFHNFVNYGASDWLVAGRRHFGTSESVLFPCVALSQTNSGDPHTSNLIGTLDGVFAVPGDGVSFETLISISAVNYLVVRNIFRTAGNNFMAIKLV